MSEGLVRRVKNRQNETLDGNSSNNSVENDNNKEQEEEDFDSKETRLTLMEEVLLLGLKDKEVCMHNKVENIIIIKNVKMSISSFSSSSDHHLSTAHGFTHIAFTF